MRPNILLFHCHDLGRHLPVYGRRSVQAPHIERLAAEGVVFNKSFCVAPQCSPSRASMFTGRYPHQNGVLGLTHADFAWDLHEDERHLAGLLRDAGYHTASVGVLHETQQPAEHWGYEERVDLRETAADARSVSDAVVRLLESFAPRRRSGAEQPFFLCAGTFEPHRWPSRGEADYMGFLGDHIEADRSRGIEVPGYLRDDESTRKELAELQGAIRHMDVQFGQVLEALDRLELSENTLVIFTTDHGIAMPRAKCTCYDPGIEISLILRLPSRPGWHGGREIDALVSNIDLPPSLCDLAGAKMPGNVQGRSWLPLLDGRDYRRNEAIFPELTYHDYYDPIRAVRTERYKLIAFFSSAPSFMSPTQSWLNRPSPAFPESPPTAYHPPMELYDLSSDPLERVNLIDCEEHREVKEGLMKKLLDHLVSTGDPILEGAVTSPMHRRTVNLLKSNRLS